MHSSGGHNEVNFKLLSRSRQVLFQKEAFAGARVHVSVHLWVFRGGGGGGDISNLKLWELDAERNVECGHGW